jgi:hypothetical protein
VNLNIGKLALQPDGSFDLQGLVNGSYKISYVVFGSQGWSSEYQTVRVSDADVNEVALVRKPSVEVSGSITVEGSQPEKLDMFISLASPEEGQVGSILVGDDKKFAMTVDPPGLYDLLLARVPSGKYVKSIRLGDREVKNGEIDLTGSSAVSLNIVLGADGGEVRGNAQMASGQPAAAAQVTLVPADEYDGRSDLVKRAVTDASGNFEIKDVAPGEYKAFALESDPDGNTQSAEFREPFESKGVPVSIGPNDKASVQLNVIPAEEIVKEIGKLP